MRLYVDNRAVTAAGTPERLNEEANAYRRYVLSVTIRALTTNAGNIYVAGRQDRATITTDGFILSAGETLTLDVSQFFDEQIDLQDIWIDADVNGDAVCFVAFEVK